MFKKVKKYLKSLKEAKNKGQKQFIIRIVLFLSIYFTISRSYGKLRELLGQEEITVNDGYLSFIIYFLIGIFIYARREKIKNLYSYRNGIFSTILFSIIAVVAFLLPYESVALTLHLNDTVTYFLLYGIGQFSVFLAIFGIPIFMTTFNEEVLTIILILILSASTPIIADLYWAYFFKPIKYGVVTILSFMSSDVMVDDAANGFMVQLGNFKGAVGPSCSGLFSMSTFSFLFITSLMLLKRQNKINKHKAIAAFVIGLAILYVLNIFRIIIILYVGANYSVDLAINLFHEYLSSIFLMSVFMIYLYKVLPRITMKGGHNLKAS